MFEAMSNYRRATRLPPIGPHRSQLPDFTKACPICQGKGIIDTEDGASFYDCKNCDGTGILLTVTEEEHAAIVKQGMKLFDEWIAKKQKENT